MPEQIRAISTVSPLQQTENRLIIDQPSKDNSFSNVLKSALNQISKQEHESNVKTELLAKGKIDDLHDVMITAQKASITVETAVQVQQKVIDIYNEMMRMQV
ncbi:flagellar hook-basal body complex protein FliE [Pseudogracilibacillus auburnensis]|uniref:flagellar hook-basal body complex protein FliE n=1 Tax=Pseudogracilibacillus auburnensis TaxID=1494959 RepID=UPI001F612616|nr:flagellar hook-basal body complex protein FliE [Pseudogracilibacillus auburnensis]